jgi:hypothetical protein
MAVTNLIVKRLAVILHDREADAVSTPPERSDRDSAPSGKLDAVNSQLQSVRKVRSGARSCEGGACWGNDLSVQELASKNLELEQVKSRWANEREEGRKTSQTEASGNLLRLRNANAMSTMRAAEADSLKGQVKQLEVDNLTLAAETARYKSATARLSVRPARAFSRLHA